MERFKRLWNGIDNVFGAHVRGDCELKGGRGRGGTENRFVISRACNTFIKLHIHFRQDRSVPSLEGGPLGWTVVRTRFYSVRFSVRSKYPPFFDLASLQWGGRRGGRRGGQGRSAGCVSEEI